VKCIHLKKKRSFASLLQSKHHENNVAKKLKLKKKSTSTVQFKGTIYRILEIFIKGAIQKFLDNCYKTQITSHVDIIFILQNKFLLDQYICLHVSSHTLQAFEDGPDRGFRNVGQYKPDAGETPKI
jgi:hypothetical protein